MKIEAPLGCWRMGTRLRKKSGASWQGKVVGYYTTDLTDVGYAIESEREPGSVQIYPAKALEPVPE
jgi:dihydrofolate reductase (trimethoprim resistance protein)